MYYGYVPPYQYPYQNQSPTLNGQVVDSLDMVRVKDIDLSGNPTYYPNVNGNEIYKKQLMPDGTSRITVYQAMTGQEQIQNNGITTEQLEQLKNDIIAEIKQMLG